MVRKSHLLLSSHDSLAGSACEDQDLVYQVYFVANVSADWNLHGDELRVQARVDDFSELAKRADFGSQALEVDHLVLWGLSGHFVVFGAEGRSGGQCACGQW